MKTGRGFTLVESAVVVGAVAVGLSLMAVSIGTREQPEKPKLGENDPETVKAKKAAKLLEMQLKDATMIRGVHQGLVMYGTSNGEKFPLPSVLDKKDDTVKETGAEKDTTANIMSVMIYNGFFGPEMLISAAESNEKIKACETYVYDRPPKAPRPELALWDPAFSVDFTGGNTGGLSFAHAMPSKSRLEQWKNKQDVFRPVVGNRGPKVTGVKVAGEGVEPELPEKSKTFAIHGDPATWEGNIAFADNHVDFAKTMWNTKHVYKDAEDKEHPDLFFYNEPEDAKDTNTVLGIFVNAGATTKSFKGIWD